MAEKSINPSIKKERAKREQHGFSVKPGNNLVRRTVDKYDTITKELYALLVKTT